jgi:hypothetical protein
VTNAALLDRILAGLDNLAKIGSHLARLVELAEQQAKPATPRSYVTADQDTGISDWLAGKR